MYEFVDHFSLIAIPLYLGFFHLYIYVLVKEELWNMNPYEHQNFDIIYKAGLRGEQISFTLTGFAIIALVFIITVFNERLAEVELVIVYFSIGFFLEIFSAFLFHDMKKFGYQISASIFQYGGLFAIILGFFTFLTDLMEWSFYIQSVYVVGVIGFIFLTGKEMQVYKDYRKKKDSNE